MARKTPKLKLRTLQEVIKELRHKTGWTEAELARELGTTPQAVSRMEHGAEPEEAMWRILAKQLRPETDSGNLDTYHLTWGPRLRCRVPPISHLTGPLSLGLLTGFVGVMSAPERGEP